ncbi:murein biosynthesis integral membrane protein MurJ [Desulfobacula sp.]|uniref:murein biosynthesis integral membrane protein MurJ n=1 Tax=Desulfobacula sp. TaxID=2593537 RepID=UPI00263861F2|nr:murein biosynthesis integral membrane protein MurJ [Desulfobacula sp.]
MADETLLKKIGWASVIMMASVFASRVIGVFREMAIAGFGGIKAGVDAYQIAFILPEILNHIVASGFLSITFIPIFAHYLSLKRTEEGYRVFSIILNGFGLVLLCFILVTMIWAPQFVRLFAPGIQDPETFGLAVKMTRIIIPAQFFFFAGGLLMAVQFAHEKFFIPALAPLIYNICIILGGLLLGPFMGMEGFAWGVLAGAFLGNFAVQLIGTKKLGVQYFPIINFTHPDLIRYIGLTLPLMIGLTMTFSTEILLKFFGSYLTQGSIAAMNYALRVMFILVGLFGQAIGMASYPFMAKLAQKGDMVELNRVLNRTLKFIFLVIPFSVLFIVLSHEIIQILFQRGQFDAEATRVTAGILPFFMVGAFAFSAQNIVSRGYYALQNTLFPAVFTSLCVVLTLPFIYLFMRTMGPRGVALGLSLSVTLQAFILFECWNKKSLNTEKKEVYLFFLKMILISLVIGSILFITAMALRHLIDPSTFLGSGAIVGLIGIEFLSLFFFAGILLKIQEILYLYKTIYERLFPWMKPSL